MSPSGLMILTAFAGIAEFERELIRGQTRDVGGVLCNAAACSGIVPSRDLNGMRQPVSLLRLKNPSERLPEHSKSNPLGGIACPPAGKDALEVRNRRAHCPHRGEEQQEDHQSAQGGGLETAQDEGITPQFGKNGLRTTLVHPKRDVSPGVARAIAKVAGWMEEGDG